MGKSTKKRSLFIFVPVTIGLIYMLLCISQIRQPVWLGESYNAYYTRYDFSELIDASSSSVHPPLYYLLLKTWSHFLGHSNVSMRMLSVLCGAIAILFFYILLKRRYGIKIAVIVSTLLAVALPFVGFGAVINMYPLTIAIAAIATFALKYAQETGKKSWWVLYAFLLTAGLLTHYLCIVVWIVHIIIYRKKLSRAAITSYAVALLLFAIWLPGIISQIQAISTRPRTCGINAVCFSRERGGKNIYETIVAYDDVDKQPIVASSDELRYDLAFYFVGQRPVYHKDEIMNDFYDKYDSYYYVFPSDENLEIKDGWRAAQIMSAKETKDSKNYAIVKIVKE